MDTLNIICCSFVFTQILETVRAQERVGEAGPGGKTEAMLLGTNVLH
jgi:hypothetical protein